MDSAFTPLCTPDMWHGGSGACTAASWKKVLGSIPACGADGTGGRFLPRPSGGLSRRPFCVEFACSPCVLKGFPPLRALTENHAEEQNTLLSVPDQDGRI